MRHEIEERCGIDAVDIYGLSEVIGPGVASECIETKDGPTIGKITSTPRLSIRNPVSRWPMERWASWFSPLSPRRHCQSFATAPATLHACYRALHVRCAVWDKITGRSDDMLIIRGVNVFPTQIEERVLQQDGAFAALPVTCYA